VLLIGVDGMEWDVVLELVHAGYMPALGALMARGIYGELASFRPTQSPIIWTSIATGDVARKHGIRGFVKPRRPGDQGLRLYSSRDRRRKAFWNILSERGKRVDVVGWWNTYPVEPVNGVMVAQVNTTTLAKKRHGDSIWKGSLVEGLDDQVYPPERQGAILALAAREDARLDDTVARIFGSRQGESARSPSPLASHLLEQSRWAIRADGVYRRVALSLLADPDAADLSVLAVYFGGADVVGHRFWRYAHPELYRDRPTPEEIEAFGGAVRGYYTYLDSVIGELVAAAPKPANVIVVGDHGMRAANRRGRFRMDGKRLPRLSGAHTGAPPSVFVAAGPSIANDADAPPLETVTRRDLRKIGSVLDITPTLLALTGLPLDRSMDGSVLRDVLDPTFLRSHRPSFVKSYTEDGWRVAGGDAEGDPDLRKRIEQLRALGYLR